MQVEQITYVEKTVVATYHGFDIAVRDAGISRPGFFYRSYYLQKDGIDASIGYQEMRDAKAQATKLAKAQAEKQSYMK